MTDEKIEWFEEWVFFDNEQELEEALKYLALWYKFILKRLKPMFPVEEVPQIILRPITNVERGTLGVKFAMKNKKPDFIFTKLIVL